MRFLLPIAALLALTACQPAGPAERAGKSLDKTGESISDALNPPGPAQSTGRKIDKALGN
jgi:hypothetical protein